MTYLKVLADTHNGLIYVRSTVILIRYGTYQYSKLIVRILHLELREECRFTSHNDNQFLP